MTRQRVVGRTALARAPAAEFSVRVWRCDEVAALPQAGYGGELQLLEDFRWGEAVESEPLKLRL